MDNPITNVFSISRGWTPAELLLLLCVILEIFILTAVGATVFLLKTLSLSRKKNTSGQENKIDFIKFPSDIASDYDNGRRADCRSENISPMYKDGLLYPEGLISGTQRRRTTPELWEQIQGIASDGTIISQSSGVMKEGDDENSTAEESVQNRGRCLKRLYELEQHEKVIERFNFEVPNQPPPQNSLLAWRSSIPTPPLPGIRSSQVEPVVDGLHRKGRTESEGSDSALTDTTYVTGSEPVIEKNKDIPNSVELIAGPDKNCEAVSIAAEAAPILSGLRKCFRDEGRSNPEFYNSGGGVLSKIPLPSGVRKKPCSLNLTTTRPMAVNTLHELPTSFSAPLPNSLSERPRRNAFWDRENPLNITGSLLEHILTPMDSSTKVVAALGELEEQIKRLGHELDLWIEDLWVLRDQTTERNSGCAKRQLSEIKRVSGSGPTTMFP
ncbi:MAG: hypothetical protein M1834_004992 [Cirrosporium novae-zelandiae]|nr:MAG: hypothetical protein M1834_004992 [Cirrosporium novae-zelandiae]